MRKVISTGLLMVAALITTGATYEVASIADLRTRINGAVAGDVIVLKNGVYATTSSIGVNRVGTAGSPIVIKAESVGGAEIGGTHGFSLNSGARYVRIEGFKFTHTSGRNAINLNANFCRFSRNTFECPGDGNYLVVAGDDAEVDRNEFRNKSTVGNMIDVRGTGSQIARRVWIHHNYFHDFSNAGENGAETIRFGLSGLSLSTSNGLIEHNLFINCRGENELISVKASVCTTRYNTLLNSSGAQLTQRHGNDCLIYGNYLKGTAGIRIYGDRHQIFSNYLEGNSIGIDMGNGGGEVADGDPLTSHDRPDDCTVSFNTLVNNNLHYQRASRSGGLGSIDITVANNIFQGGSGRVTDVRGSEPYIGTWSGNIVWNNTNVGSMPASGYTTVNPLLAADAFGVYRLQAGSPAIDTAVGTYAAVTADMDGQSRSGAKDKGADEISSEALIARQPLTVNDVGPNSSEGPAPPAPVIVSFEAETLTHTEQGATAATQNDASASSGVWYALLADGLGDWIEYTLPGVPSGTYQVTMRYKAHPNRGILTASVNGNAAPGTVDQYAATVGFPEADFGQVTLSAPGSVTIRLTVAGRNAAAGAFTLSADLFKLTKLDQSAAENWVQYP